MPEKEPWVYQLDWSNITNILGLESVLEIPEFKREKAIKKITKIYGTESLLSFNPNELDKLVAKELKDLMKKELILLAKKRQRMEREMQAKAGDLKKAGIIGIDLNDIKDLDPEDIVKFFNKTIRGVNDDDDDKDDDKDKYDDDRNGYYI